MDLRLTKDPASWLTDHGRPATCLGTNSLATFESGNRNLLLMSALIMTRLDLGRVMFFPHGYVRLCERYPDHFVKPHAKSTIPWRPCVYEMVIDGIEGRSSQQELQIRKQTGDTQLLIEILAPSGRLGPDELAWAASGAVAQKMSRARERAEKLLVSQLSPQQRLEFCATHRFRVRGASGSMYRIDASNGFDLVDKRTTETIRGFCLHTEYWMPDEDIALATMLALGDPELEEKCLKNAGRGVTKKGRKATDEDRVAYRYEKRLIPGKLLKPNQKEVKLWTSA